MAITDNLSAYWNLSEASGQRNDSSANANHLTASASTPTGTTGPGGHNATLFTRASSQNLFRASTASLQMGNIDSTVALWAKYTSFTDFQAIASHGFGSTRSWQIYQYSATNRYFAANISSNGSAFGADLIGSNGGVTALATWYFIVMWHNSVADTFNLQVNNGTANSFAHTTGAFTSTGTIFVGDRDGGGWYLDGALAMMGVWKKVLTAGEKTTLYNSGNGLSYAEMLASEALNLNINPGTMIRGT